MAGRQRAREDRTELERRQSRDPEANGLMQERDLEGEDLDRDPVDRDVEAEADAAAAEAGRIGGRTGADDQDPAERASAEHGGGESEGFEQAEELLEEHASHGDEHGGPLRNRPDPEPGPARGEFADADDIESTETDVDTQGTPGDLDGSGEDGVPDTET